jgi:bile acid:Na+ symporter, BASS family
MAEVLDKLLKLSLVIFMVGNLLDMGLKLKIQDALCGLRNRRFVVLSVLWGFILCPALAYLLTKIIPLQQPYAIGMVLLGMAPCAPFLPAMTEKARGDMGYAAAFMLLASVITVVYMPFAVPLMVKGLTADPWTIAKPLLFFVLMPLAIGMVIKRALADRVVKLGSFVRKTTDIDTIAMLAVCVAVYYKGFIGAVGTYAIGTQILFFSLATVASYTLSFGLPHNQKSVLILGMATRNIGAALAPLFAIADIDQRAIVMVALGVPIQTIASLLAARWCARRASIGEPEAEQIGPRRGSS